MIPDILYKSEAEEEMATDLRASFNDRQHKWLSEPIKFVAHPAKRPYSDEVHEEPIMEASPTPVPPLDATGSSNVPTSISSVRVETFPA